MQLLLGGNGGNYYLGYK